MQTVRRCQWTGQFFCVATSSPSEWCTTMKSGIRCQLCPKVKMHPPRSKEGKRKHRGSRLTTQFRRGSSSATCENFGSAKKVWRFLFNRVVKAIPKAQPSTQRTLCATSVFDLPSELYALI